MTTRRSGTWRSTWKSVNRRAVDLFYQEFFSDPILAEFRGDAGYANLGYWDETVHTAAEAGDRLVDELLKPLPDHDGTILDVACGHGGSTRRLTRYFDPDRITATGISNEQLDAARARAPGCTFVEMDPAALSFDEASFDAVLSVEAAFHFETRERFLGQAMRVLKPGGHLLMSDLLMTRGTPLIPSANYVPGVSGYGELLRRAGFTDVVVIDATVETWHEFRRALTSFMFSNPKLYGSPYGWRDVVAANIGWAWALRACVIVHARKPTASSS